MASTVFNTVFQGLFNTWLQKQPEFSPRLREAFFQGDVIEVIKLLNDMGVLPDEMLGCLQTIMGLSETVTSLRDVTGSHKYLMKMSAVKLGRNEYFAGKA